jgi:hypothetical protein
LASKVRRGVALAAALLAVCAALPLPLLEVRLEEGQVLWREALRPGEPVTVSYRHSVTGRPVREVYTLGAGGGLRVREHAYRTQGAGLGQVEGEGRVLEAPGGWTRVVGLDRDVGAFALRVGQPSADHRLQVRGRELELSRTWAGKRVWIGGRLVPLFRWFLLRVPAAPQPLAPWEERS